MRNEAVMTASEAAKRNVPMLVNASRKSVLIIPDVATVADAAPEGMVPSGVTLVRCYDCGGIGLEPWDGNDSQMRHYCDFCHGTGWVALRSTALAESGADHA